MTNETRTIESGDLVDFTFKIQQAILDGYRLSDQGDLAPQNIGWVFVTTVEKPEYQTMPVAEMTLTLNVDTEQAVAQIQELASVVGELDADSAAQIVAQAMTVEPSNIESKPTQRRGPKSR